MADNLNTVYLSTPGVGAVNQTSAASTSFSDVSVVNNVIASGISAATGQFSSTLSVAGATKAAHVACAGVTSSSASLATGSSSGTTSAVGTGASRGEPQKSQNASPGTLPAPQAGQITLAAAGAGAASGAAASGCGSRVPH